jgi:D-alanyl-D-alanine carboxypeptidase/D-alanyl-D-alanine-endopeptidase (penicillin-binding protein 4)
MVPASTQKLLTAAAVLGRLAPTQRFITRVLGPPPDATGTINGDVWLVGDGDPALGSDRGASHAASGEPWYNTVTTELARSLWRAGVRRITGTVVGDGRALMGGGLLPGWAWDDAPYAYSAPPAGLTLYEGTTRLDLSVQGSSVVLGLTPATQEVQVSLSPLLPENDGLFLLPGSALGAVEAWWRAANGKTSARDFVAVPNPARYAAEQLAHALQAAGILVAQAWRTPAPNELLPRTVEFAAVPSATVRELCALMLRNSLNLHAEMLLMQLGRWTGPEASTRGGLQRVTEFVLGMGREPMAMRLVDGSGLSRMNLLSAQILVDALRSALRQDPGFADLLSTMGVNGTLENRLVGTPAAGRVRAKTGTLTGHRNMVGVLETLRGQTLHFAILLGGVVPPRAVVDTVVDQALMTLLTL